MPRPRSRPNRGKPLYITCSSSDILPSPSGGLQHPQSQHKGCQGDHSDHQHYGHGGHSHYPDSPVSRLFDRIGLIALSTKLAHSGRWTLISIACYILALIMSTELASRAFSHVVAHTAQAVALACTFLLSGLPQTVEAACVAGSGKLDTHVLMSLAVFGTLALGMAQEVGPMPT